MEPLLKLPDILDDNFCIMMDHVETAAGGKVFLEMKRILDQQGVLCQRMEFASHGHQIGILISDGWRYVEDF